nr:G-type lectin S-receptor-like serine/threonine-protein kinase At4g27290 [Ipomoea batatas]
MVSFTPGQSSYYAGIWYKQISPQTVIWVANREAPISFPTWIQLQLNIKGGNLVLTTGSGNSIWSTNLTSPREIPFQATLLETGNLVIFPTGRIFNATPPLWQSFDYPAENAHAPRAARSNTGSSLGPGMGRAFKDIPNPMYNFSYVKCERDYSTYFLNDPSCSQGIGPALGPSYDSNNGCLIWNDEFLILSKDDRNGSNNSKFDSLELNRSCPRHRETRKNRENESNNQEIQLHEAYDDSDREGMIEEHDEKGSTFHSSVLKVY